MSLRDEFRKTLKPSTAVGLLLADNNSDYIAWLENKVIIINHLIPKKNKKRRLRKMKITNEMKIGRAKELISLLDEAKDYEIRVSVKNNSMMIDKKNMRKALSQAIITLSDRKE